MIKIATKSLSFVVKLFLGCIPVLIASVLSYQLGARHKSEEIKSFQRSIGGISKLLEHRKGAIAEMQREVGLLKRLEAARSEACKVPPSNDLEDLVPYNNDVLVSTYGKFVPAQ